MPSSRSDFLEVISQALTKSTALRVCLRVSHSRIRTLCELSSSLVFHSRPTSSEAPGASPSPLSLISYCFAFLCFCPARPFYVEPRNIVDDDPQERVSAEAAILNSRVHYYGRLTGSSDRLLVSSLPHGRCSLGRLKHNRNVQNKP